MKKIIKIYIIIILFIIEFYFIYNCILDSKYCGVASSHISKLFIITKNYIHELDKSYQNSKNNKCKHTIYGEKCSKCNKLIGEFKFQSIGQLICPAYPRLYKLSNYWNNTWLLGGNDNNRVICRRSTNMGESWSEPSLVSQFPDHICANVDFFELSNHDIISSYRAIGNNLNNNDEIKYNRKLASSISHDGGITWENLGIIIDNFELAIKLNKTKEVAINACRQEERIGFFEPFVEMINNKITVFYADDFTTMILEVVNKNPQDNYKTQNIYSQTFNIETKTWSNERNLIIDGTIKKSPTGSGLKKRISRDGMPVVNTMKDGTYVLVFEGTYRDIDYPLLTGRTLKEYVWFEILLSYSKDGINWSNPVEVFTPKNSGSKASAPYVVSNELNQIIISFQTDEDSITSGFKGDSYSIMKVMVSKPGIPIEKINKNSFYALCNNNNSPIGGISVWNGMMVIENNILYTCSSNNLIKYSEIPLYVEIDNYNHRLKHQYYIIEGRMNFQGNKLFSVKEKNLVLNKIIDTSKTNLFYSFIIPNGNTDCGLIFGIKDLKHKSNEKFDYFTFLINRDGYLSLSKHYKGELHEIIQNNNRYLIKNFHPKNKYKMKVKYNPDNGNIEAYLDDIQIYNIVDNSLGGNKIGLISYGKGAIFTQILSE